ncbi:diguanylate cyclase [bacterium]|nr:diguanylate cyclase [bacterium]
MNTISAEERAKLPPLQSNSAGRGRTIRVILVLGWIVALLVSLWSQQVLWRLPWDVVLALVLTWRGGRKLGWVVLLLITGLTAALHCHHPDFVQLWPMLFSQSLAGMVLVYGLDELRCLWNKAEVLARRDYLTGIFNRKALHEALTAEMARQHRYGRPFTLVLWDCDGFKMLNDQQGHLTGDRVLVTFAETLRTHVRQYDTVARLGGDEFVVLLAEADLSEAEPILERLRTEIRFALERQFSPLSVSAGVVVFRRPPDTVETCLSRVDAAMYRAKRRGPGETEIELFDEVATPSTISLSLGT